VALKSVFSALKKEGYITKDLDLYLLSLNSEENDRAIDVNAPSQIGTCLRSRYYARTGAPLDSNAIDARARRIFDNGSYVHIRLQEYLKKLGKLLMDEVPVYSKEFNIQGHTDGIIRISSNEVAVLEIKSINSKGFSDLKDAKADHKLQGLTYAFCLEERRKFLQKTYPSLEEFEASEKSRKKDYESLYQHLKSGHKYTREQKIEYQVSLHLILDNLLFDVQIPITKVIFLYESKDTQELKEYCILSKDTQSIQTLDKIKEDCAYLNNCVKNVIIPPRCSSSVADSSCRWCSYKTECWN